MDKLDEVFGLDLVLNEAARFGSREIETVLRNHSKFRVGLEYEFVVDEGVSQVDAQGDGNSVAMYIQLARTIERPVTQISESIYSLLTRAKDNSRFSTSELIVEVEDILTQPIDEMVTDFIEENIYPEINEIAESCFAIAVASGEIMKAQPDLKLSDIGIWPFMDVNNRADMRVALNKTREQRVDSQGARSVLPVMVKFLRQAVQYERIVHRLYRGKDDLTISDDLMNEIAVKYERMASAKNLSGQKSKVDIVRETHPLPDNLVEDIVFDISVNDGAELITVPLNMQQLQKVMYAMGDYIKKVGSTNSHTGLHVNVSLSGIVFNPVRAITYLNPESFQRPRHRQSQGKYPPRLLIESVLPYLSSCLEAIARAYLKNGVKGLVSDYEYFMKIICDKNKNVNLLNYIDNYDPARRRVEYRFFGGAGYENRTEEMHRDILQVLYTAYLADERSPTDRQYVEDIIKMLDQAARHSKSYESATKFTDVVQLVRQKDRM